MYFRLSKWNGNGMCGGCFKDKLWWPLWDVNRWKFHFDCCHVASMLFIYRYIFFFFQKQSTQTCAGFRKQFQILQILYFPTFKLSMAKVSFVFHFRLNQICISTTRKHWMKSNEIKQKSSFDITYRCNSFDIWAI